MRYVVLLPAAGFLIGTPFLNRVEPLVLGLPLVLAWLILCVLSTSAAITLVWLSDHKKRGRG